MPPATWKLNIWAAKMNAAMTPISGIDRSSSVLLAWRTAYASTTTVTTQKKIDIGTLRNRSGAWSAGSRRAAPSAAIADMANIRVHSR